MVKHMSKEERVFAKIEAINRDRAIRVHGRYDALKSPKEKRAFISKLSTALTHRKNRLTQKKLQDDLLTARRAATTDALTGLTNRGHATKLAEEQIEKARDPLSLIMLDIDHFKAVNDTYGHSTGDEVIQAVAQTLKDCMRTGDIAARWGGEEFMVIPDPRSQKIINANDKTNGKTTVSTKPVEQSKKDATLLAERIRMEVSKLKFHGTNSAGEKKQFSITVSLGVAVSTANPGDGLKLFGTACKNVDTALYGSKENGRNQVQCYDQSMDPTLVNNKAKATGRNKVVLSKLSEDKLDAQPRTAIIPTNSKNGKKRLAVLAK